MRLADLVKRCGGRVVRGGDVDVTAVTIDSRKANADVAFVACRGVTATSRDGHDFISGAVDKGARVVVQESGRDDVKDVALAEVDDPRRFVALAAEVLAGSPTSTLTVIGTTGTNGKTTVSFLIAQMLQALGHKAAVFGTLGIGAPDAPQPMGYTTPEAEVLSGRMRDLVDEGYTHVCMEVSSHALATQRAEGVHIDIGAFTNLSQDHLDFHGSMEAYFAAKLRLFRERLEEGATAVVPVGVDGLASAVADGPAKPLWIGANDGLHVAHVEQSLRGMTLTLRDGDDDAQLTAPLFGAFNVDNLLLAAGVGRALGIALDDIATGLSAVSGVPGRMQRVDGDGPCVLVDFAHTPDALASALAACRSVVDDGRVLVVFGAGGDRDVGKRAPMGAAACEAADVVWVTSDNPRSEDPAAIVDDIVAGCDRQQAEVHVEVDRESAIHQAVAMATSNDIVLIAGKGDERVQIVADERRPFDDRVVAAAALQAAGGQA